jgi:hypothetical protein
MGGHIFRLKRKILNTSKGESNPRVSKEEA